MRERISQHAFDLVAIGVTATIATHLAHLPPWLTVAIAILLAARTWTRRRSAAPVPAWIRFPAAGLLLIVVVAQYGNVFGQDHVLFSNRAIKLGVFFKYCNSTHPVLCCLTVVTLIVGPAFILFQN